MKDRLTELWEWLNSHELNERITTFGVYYSAAFFVLLAVYMLTLKPKRPLDKLFTYLIISVALVVVRVVGSVLMNRGFELWGSLTWINLAVAITLTSVYMIRAYGMRRHFRLMMVRIRR